MANTFEKAEVWASMLQSQLREFFVWKNLVDMKFEWDFDWADTVHFRRQAKIVVSDLATSYSEIPTQEITQADETFILSYRKAFSVAISDEDYKELDIDPDTQIIRDAAEKFAKEYDTVIFGEYASAWIEVTDGDMATATNWGSTNSIILSKSNVYDLITAVNQKMDEANIDANDRWIVFSPKEKRFLANAPELLRSTDLWDKTVTGWFMWTIDNMKIYWSNSLVTASSVKHALAWQGKPICFAANIKPKVQFVSSETQSNSFVNYLKAQTKFGVKTFTEGAERLVDVNLKA